MNKILSKNKGSILMEAMVAMAIFVVGMSFVLLLFVSSSKGAIYSLEGTKASLISTQSMEAMRSILNDRGWLPVGTYEVGLKDDKEWDIISTDGLVGHWKLSGDANDYSGNENHGTPVGGVTWAEDRMGQARGSAEFDGVGGYVEVGSHETTSELAIDEPYTVSLWVNSNDVTSHQAVVSQHNASYGGHSRGISIRTSMVEFWSRDSSAVWKDVYSDTISNNTWYHLVLVQNGNVIEGFLNGGSVGSLNMGSHLLDYESYHEIGDYTSSNYKFNGQIDDVRIYNRALSEDEIKALYGHYSEKHQSKVTVGDGVTDGLVGYWPMDEGSGNYVYDYSPRTDNWGKFFGPYLEFDGVDDYVEIDSLSNVGENNITYSLWVKPNTNGHNSTYVYNFDTFMGKHGGGPSGDLAVGYRADNKVRVYYENLSTGSYIDSINPIIINEWTYITVVTNSSSVSLYVNGALNSTGSIATNFVIDKMGIGNALPGVYTTPFNGQIDDVRIYNRALSEEEVSKLYRGEWVSDTGLVGHWEMDEGHGGQVRDKSGNGNHGTIHGATWGSSAPEWVSDTSGGALEFDGVGDYIDLSNDSLGITNKITVSTWIKPNNFSTVNVAQRVVAKEGSFLIQSCSTSDQYDGTIILHNGSTWIGVINNIDLVPNEWQLLIGTYDGSAMKVYVNGILGGMRNEVFSIPASTSNLRFGKGTVEESANYYPYDGSVSDIRIYNRALSEAEIQKIYEYGRTNKFYLSE